VKGRFESITSIDANAREARTTFADEQTFQRSMIVPSWLIWVLLTRV
jgi:hypothetical protein